MCNPDDQNPCIYGDPGDQRPQRSTHPGATPTRRPDRDRARAMLASGQLGSHHGLPVTIIVSTTLQDLESASGYAVTGGGTLLPMRDVIRLASHAHHYLAVFDKHTREALYLGRTKRFASPGQRIVLYRCTAAAPNPAAPSPPYGCEVHHAARDWKRGGKPTSTNSAWPANPTTCSSRTPAGPPECAKTAAPNGSHHPTSTPAKPASTTTTTPNACSTETTTKTTTAQTTRTAATTTTRSGSAVLMGIAEVGQLGARRAVGYGGSPTRGEDRPGPCLHRVQARG